MNSVPAQPLIRTHHEMRCEDDGAAGAVALDEVPCEAAAERVHAAGRFIKEDNLCVAGLESRTPPSVVIGIGLVVQIAVLSNAHRQSCILPPTAGSDNEAIVWGECGFQHCARDTRGAQKRRHKAPDMVTDTRAQEHTIYNCPATGGCTGGQSDRPHHVPDAVPMSRVHENQWGTAADALKPVAAVAAATCAAIVARIAVHSGRTRCSREDVPDQHGAVLATRS